jgi:hypothetical protein
MIRALAVLCFRNERVHIRRCLSDLISSGLDVAAIDHGSRDGSHEAAAEFLGRGLVRLERMPWTGSFSLSEQLRAKRQMIAVAVDYDWIVHVDADEKLCAPRPGQSLLDGMREADACGANCINFHELVFVPLSGEDFLVDDYADRMRAYYFFQPRYPRLKRAWKRSADLDNSASGGHALAGAHLRLHEQDFILRHYIALSEAHARTKYVGRAFSEEDVSRGWHRNRLDIRADALRVKPCRFLKHLRHAGDSDFDLSDPAKTHFWQW